MNLGEIGQMKTSVLVYLLKIFETLVNNDFDLKEIEELMNNHTKGESFSKKPSVKPLQTKSTIVNTNNYISGAEKFNVPNNTLELYTIENLQSDCKELVKLIKADMIDCFLCHKSIWTL